MWNEPFDMKCTFSFDTLNIFFELILLCFYLSKIFIAVSK